MLSRRELLATAAALPAAATTQPSKPRLGGTPTAFYNRAQAARRANQPFDIVEHCHSLGLAGVEMPIRSTEAESIRKLRGRLEAYRMHLVVDVRLPREPGDVAAFESQLKAYKDAGALALHVAMTGRRYEVFDSLEAFKKHWEQCQTSVALAEPLLSKYRIKLAIENHKDWRYAEHVAWLKRVSSEWVGVCVDTGNNLSLCDDPIELVTAYAPYAVFSHLKDMGVDEYADGFLLSEVVMGEGVLDLPRMVAILRQANANVIFDLEMITRDPLRVPVLTDKYWATFDTGYSPLPGRDLAHTLALVRARRSQTPLPRYSNLSPEDQVKAEDDNNQKCIAWAREHLAL